MKLSTKGFSFILVEPGVPQNAGAAARALKTMGFTDLRIVLKTPPPQAAAQIPQAGGQISPVAPGGVGACHGRQTPEMGPAASAKNASPGDLPVHLCEKAMTLAHGSREILEGARVFSSLAEAAQDLDFLVATTARRRRSKHTQISSAELPGFLTGNRQGCRIGIVFGPEDRGLLNEEIDFCDITSFVPLACDFPSLNLAQAVMVYSYALAMGTLESAGKASELDPPAVSPVPQDWGKLSYGNVGTRGKTAADTPRFRAVRSRVSKLLGRVGIGEATPAGKRIIGRLGAMTLQDVGLVHTIVEKVESSITPK